jgi:LysM repeat protein
MGDIPAEVKAPLQHTARPAGCAHMRLRKRSARLEPVLHCGVACPHNRHPDTGETAMAGLFDFARNIGKKLFNREDDTQTVADKIKQSLTVLNLPRLDVAYQDGTVTLSGEAQSPEQKEKAVLMAGNVEGVEKVEAAQLQAPEATTAVEYYIIEKGDTLSKIARHFYGEASAYPRIFEANREVIEDPDKIYPGQKIRIPKE